MCLFNYVRIRLCWSVCVCVCLPLVWGGFVCVWEDQKMKETVKYLLQYLDQNFLFYCQRSSSMTNKRDGHIMHTCMNTICECVCFFFRFVFFSEMRGYVFLLKLKHITYWYISSELVWKYLRLLTKKTCINHHEALRMLRRRAACRRFCQVYICGLSRSRFIANWLTQVDPWRHKYKDINEQLLEWKQLSSKDNNGK